MCLVCRNKEIMKIALATHYTPNYAALGDLTAANKKEYCLKHGYAFICPSTEEIHEEFYKYSGFFKAKFLYDLFKECDYDYVHWSGADAWIMNYNIKIEDWIDKEHKYAFYVAKEQSGDYKGAYNADVIIVKKSYEGIKILEFLLEKWKEPRYKKGQISWEEQQVMIDYFDTFEYKDYVKVMPHSSFNSYPWRFYDLHQQGTFTDYDGLPGCFKSGDFLMHTPGHVLHNRIRIFNFYKDQIIK